MTWFIIALMGSAAAAFGVGYGLRALRSRKTLSSAEAKSKQVLEDAHRQAQTTA